MKLAEADLDQGERITRLQNSDKNKEGSSAKWPAKTKDPNRQGVIRNEAI